MAIDEHTAVANSTAIRRRALFMGLVAAALGAVAVAWIHLAQVLPGVDATLVDMGFDPDRARLISALTAGALVAILASLLTGGRIAPVLVGAAVFGSFDFSRFRSETIAALGAHGIDGRFDSFGWALTAATLVMYGLAICWAASRIALAARDGLVPVGKTFRDGLAGYRPTRRQLRRVGGTGLIFVLLVATSGTFGDLMNFSPDVRMRTGVSLPVGLFSGPATAPGATGGPAAAATAITGLAAAGGLVTGPLPGSYVTAGVLATARPWAAHPPTGLGRIETVWLPGPWTGGTRATAQVDVYLPPGYGQGTIRYPVVYETHYPLDKWTTSMQLPAVLDSLIASGTIPPEIFVFASTGGGPYADSECADSFDGREWFDRYMATTLVSYVDSHYPTIRAPAARALMGYSQGGYCVSAILFRHPDVFGQAISLSGYYTAGLASRTTINAWMPFNRDPALIRAASPIDIAPTLPAAVRTRLFIILSADPSVEPFGSQMTAFARVLEGAGVPVALFTTPNAHSWPVVRTQLPTFLELVAFRQAKLGVALGGG